MGEGVEIEADHQPTKTRGWNIINLDALKRPPEDLAALVYVVCSLILAPLLILGLVASFRFAYETVVGSLTDRVDAAKVFFPVIVALIGGPILIWRALTAHWSAQAARHQAETGREAHFTSLFTKAVEQLGATREATRVRTWVGTTTPETPQEVTETEPNLEVRLGAIYALERVAQDSERDHWPIMEVLCSYIRNPQNCGTPVPRPDNALPIGHDTPERGNSAYQNWLQSIPEPRVDIQAALRVIGRRPDERLRYERSRAVYLDFKRANMQLARFNSGKFAHADFSSAHLDGASMSLANCSGASFVEAHLGDATLMRSNVDDCNFFQAIMYRARLIRASCNRASFVEANLAGAIFTGAQLVETDFESARLNNVRFTGATLRDVTFDSASVRDVDFVGAKLHGVEFTRATVFGASFMDATFDGGHFMDAKVLGAAFFSSNLSSVLGLSTGQLSSCLGDSSTILPEGIARPSNWPDKVLSPKERMALIRKTRTEIRFLA